MAIITGCCLYATQALALDLGGSDAGPAIDIHGFASQGFIVSTGNDYLVSTSKSGSFEFSEAGLNFTTQLTEKLRVGLQLFAFDLGTLGNYDFHADWFYLDYHFRDSLGIRIGRVKLPFGLYNDISDIDAARTTVLLPTSVYPPTNRDFLLAVTGAEVYGYLDLNRAGALDYRAVGGAIDIELPSQIGQPEQASTLDVPYIAEGRLLWETPLTGLRLGGSALVLKVNEAVVFPTTPTMPPLIAKETAYEAIGSAEYAAHGVLLAAEYNQSRAVITDNQPGVLPASTTVSENYYGLATYRVTKWLQPGAYFSVAHPNRNVVAGRETFQDDLAGTLRFDVNNFWIIKLEAHYMRGTAAVAGSGTNPDSFPENWALFLVKTTAYF